MAGAAKAAQAELEQRQKQQLEQPFEFPFQLKAKGTRTSRGDGICLANSLPLDLVNDAGLTQVLAKLPFALEKKPSTFEFFRKVYYERKAIHSL